MVGAVPARRALEGLRAADLEPLVPEPRHRLSQPGTVDLVVDRMAVPLQLGGGHQVVADGGGQPIRAEPHIAAPVQDRVDLGLVGDLSARNRTSR